MTRGAPVRDVDFDRLVADYAPRVRQLAFRLLSWDPELEDVVQDVFVKAFERQAQFRGASDPGTWLFRITVNTCRSHQRRQATRRLASRLLGRAKLDGRAADPAASESDARRAAVRSAVRQLPVKEREVVVLRYYEGLDARTTGTILGLTPGAVDQRLSRARGRLRERLRTELEGD